MRRATVPYDSAECRRAYVEGAGAAYESAAITVSAGEKTALEDWLTELEQWTAGDPSPCPADWTQPPLMLVASTRESC